jgi:ATP-dependent helicase HrpA
MRHTGSGITQEHFPDAIVANGIPIPLEYHLEPGHPADGVTARIPLAALNQVPAERFEWLVPGLLREKLTALIKSLPKNLRVHFVPAPDFADRAFETLTPGDGSLYEALALFLGKQAGEAVPPEAFDPGSLLDHLHMNYLVLDEGGKPMASGRNLDEIRRKLGVKVQASFANVPHPQFHRDDITRWDFGDLPESVPVKRHGMTLSGYPALVDSGGTVSLRLMDSPEVAKTAHAAGLRRLLLTQLKDEIQYLSTMLPDLPRMCLYYKPLGPAQQLKEDLIGKTINKAFLYDSNVRTAMEFELRKEAGRRHRLIGIARDVAELANRVLMAYHSVSLLLSKPVIPAFAGAIADIRNQLAWLMPAGFLTNTPDEWLAHYPRYLKGIEVRFQKLASTGHTKDAQKQAEVMPFWQAFTDRCNRNRQERIHDPQLDTFRWMVEEFRVSLFAQELKAVIPISAKRLEKQWEMVKKG